MKKLLKIFAAFAMFATAISFASCDMATEEELLNKKTTAGGGGGAGSGSILWSSFDGAAMQVWQSEFEPYNFTASLAETEEGLEITVLDEGWWGMCFCNDASVGANSNPVTFDMSKVKTITFEAKASKAGDIWISQSPRDSKPVNKQTVTLSTEFATKTYTLSNPGTDCYGVLDIGGEGSGIVASDSIVTIRNIKFLDAEGTETVPSRNE